MLNNQRKFIETLNKIKDISINCEIDKNDTEKLLDLVENATLIVPVVGDFNAGKSTLLNKFMGKDILEVNIKPETAVPAELYYSEEEYDIGVDKDNKQIKLDNVEAENIKDYLYIKRYVNSENLKKIEPIILVDMPGFDSPFEKHNEAIISYLDKGVYYIILVPVNAGTITKSMMFQIKNIINLKNDFSLFITKTDLRNEESIKGVSEEIKNRLESIDINKDIAYINQNDICLFDSMIKELDPEQLFNSIFIDAVKDACYNTSNSINVKISALKKDKDKNDKTIKELEDSLKELQRKKESMIEEVKKNSYENETNGILSRVGKELNDSIDSLVNIALSGDSESLKDEIINIIQSIIIEKLGKVIEELNSSINIQFSDDIRNLNNILSDYNITNKINDVIERFNILGKIEGMSLSIDADGTKTIKKGYKAISTALAVFTNVIHPVLEIVIIFLPEILDLFLSSFLKSKQKEEARKQILLLIPTIKRKLKPHIIGVLKKEAEERINGISQSLDEELNKKKSEIEEAQKQQTSNDNTEELIKKYQENLKLVDEVSAYLY